ncbi:MAG: tyrosine decarboxylase MfnA, partial [Thermoplasmata archaeon]|nr:tyrosine decarboxylase MfnA [Thermoplasmata archaeon]
LQELSMKPVIDPVMNILAVHHHDPISVQERMREYGWFISRMEDPKALRFVIMPQVFRGALDDMLGDLERVLKAV